MAPYAFVTILTSDSYLPGALVTARSIKNAETTTTQAFDLVCLVTLDSVSVQSVKALRKSYDVVISVEEVRSEHCKQELTLLGRQDLSSTVTKIHIWRLVQYQKVIYLDCDTLLLKPISHLFELAHPFSASADVGWPDCFNSGLMVLKPDNERFEKIFEHFLSHGSWDGGDQGLLNDFFAQSSGEPSETGDSHPSQGWNRLSFIYNVTPSAYYTYAPAYKRYGGKISMIHFIGSEKPWHLSDRRRYRNAYFPNQQSQSLNAIDYDCLVDRWLDVYEEVVGPLEPLEYMSVQPEFRFPKYLSQWDSAQPSVYEHPTFEELKNTFTRQKASIELGLHNLDGATHESGYMSLPFLDLARIARDYAQNNQSDISTESYSIVEPVKTEEVYVPPVEHPSELPPEQSRGNQDWHPVWDAARSPPPNQGYQMNQPVSWHYQSVWDKPLHEQSHHFFQPPAISHDIPPVTYQDYSQFTTAPRPEAVKSVFPWEDNVRTQSGRIFPPEGTNDSQMATKPSCLVSNQTDQHHGKGSKSVPSAINQANLSQIYRNVWDDDPGIGRWAQMRGFLRPEKIPSSGWNDLKDKNAALIQTPRLELKSFTAEPLEITEPTSTTKQGAAVRYPPLEQSHCQQQQQQQQQQRMLPSTSYRSERDSEDCSQDADEEDVGEDEDQTSDERNPLKIDDTSSETTITTPTEALRQFNPNSRLEEEVTPKSGLDAGGGSLGSVPRLPTTRSVIVGIPVQMREPSSSSSSSSDANGHRHDNNNSSYPAREATTLLG